ncbi:tRNA uridine(34) 5-carboxymethylaminomethyl modification radical SAM/GNAT enzyme Elp3 [Candidatus Woesearchaeota archaeon]|nr:tRNA uridine(34) 5-carboxymethylaminomethyl modification radical SAM/GNAT enzyme Elp3 [Candidatus Woesearchaeota archaeon]
MNQEAFKEFIENKDRNDFDKIKIQIVKKYKLNKIPKNIDILIEDPKSNFKSKPIRTISGVAPIAIMTYPKRCNHGVCIFCPGGPESYFGDVPQSYTGNEPASMRAIRNKFDPYLQVFNRLEHYILMKHFPNKVELIIMGGTFPSYEIEYQDEFITYALKAMNDFSEIFFDNDELNFSKFKEFFELPHEIGNREIIQKVQEKLLLLKEKSTLEKEQLRNETSKIRCTVMNVETKPDWCFETHLNQMLKIGATRVEIGIQTLYDKILRITNRGHNLQDTIKAIQLTKDSFLKICAHLMIGLPETTEEMDINNFKQLFEDENYKPDALKIYPCMVMPGTPLYLQYKNNQFKPLNTDEAADLLLKVKPLIPKFCRVMRIQRDIPTKVTIDGVNITNFRQYLHELMARNNIKCNCIRCREPRNKKINFDKVKLVRYDYNSSRGEEIFLSYEDVSQDILVGFIRLRIPYKPFRPEITNKSAGIREIHVYGNIVPIGKKSEKDAQHHGYGTKLMQEAERIAKEEYDINKILVTSGIGAKAYFYKLGYKKESVYVTKNISKGL